MVAPAAQPAPPPCPDAQAGRAPLPPLAAEQVAIFDAHIACEGDLIAMAKRLDRPAHEVIRELSAAPLRDYIAAREDMNSAAVHARSIATLDKVQQTSEDAIERRRAASIIARALSGRLRAPSRRAAVAQSTVGPAPRPPRPVPQPLASPSPDRDARETLKWAAHALGTFGQRNHDRDIGLSTLHALLAPHALVCGAPVPPSPADFVGSVRSIRPGRDGAPRDSREPLAPILDLDNHLQSMGIEPIQATDSLFDARVRFIRDGGRHAPFLFRLQRTAEPPHPGCWLITEIARDQPPDTS